MAESSSKLILITIPESFCGFGVFFGNRFELYVHVQIDDSGPGLNPRFFSALFVDESITFSEIGYFTDTSHIYDIDKTLTLYIYFLVFTLNISMYWRT